MDVVLKWLGIAVGVVAGIKALYEVYKWLKPIIEVSDRFKQLDEIAAKFDTMERHNKENYETNQILCEGMLYLLRNARTNNSIDDIKRVEDKLVAHLAQK